MTNQMKAIVSVAEMARMVGLSRARFYQLLARGIFPEPLRNPDTGRPFYDEEGQKICLEEKRRNCGVNGEPILFYAPRIKPSNVTPKAQRRSKAEPKPSPYEDVLDGLHALGLTSATAKDVEQIIAATYPNGLGDMDEGLVIRAVFLAIKRQESRR